MRAYEPALVTRAVRMYASGTRTSEITEVTGLSASTIQRAVRRSDVPMRRTGRPYVYHADAPRRFVNERGYVLVHAPQHPYSAHRRKKTIFEHVWVMERHLARRLAPDEAVHHRNHDKQDNRLENLELVKKGEHSRHHRLHEFAAGKAPFGGRRCTWNERDPVTQRFLPSRRS